MALAYPIGDGFSTDLIDAARSEGISGIATFEAQRASCKRVYEYKESSAPTAEKAYEHVKRLLGYPEIKTTAAGNKYISRNIPHYINRFQRLGGTSQTKFFLYATKCDLKGKAPTTPVSVLGNASPEYKHYTFEVTYETLPYDILPDSEMVQSAPPGDTVGVPDESFWDRYVSKVARPAGEFITIPNGRLQYVSGSSHIVNQGVGKLLSFCNLQITWHQIPERGVPSVFVNPALSSASVIENTIGKVNYAGFNGYATGTLLLLGVNMMPYRSPFGDRIYDITYMFKYFRPTSGAGHNFLLRTTDSAGVKITPAVWTEVTTNGTTRLTAGNYSTSDVGYTIYDAADFGDLFKAPN